MAKNGWAHVAERADARRIELELSKAAFYKAAGISETTFRKMKAGTALASDHRRVRFCRALGWEPECIDDILAGNPPKVRALRPVEGTGDPAARGRTGMSDSAAGSPSPLSELAALVEQLAVDLQANRAWLSRHEARLDEVEREADRARAERDRLRGRLEQAEKRIAPPRSRRSGG